MCLDLNRIPLHQVPTPLINWKVSEYDEWESQRYGFTLIRIVPGS
jgi:hypothetical protein